MQIDLLYFDGCPSWQQGRDNLKTALALESVPAKINLIKVENNVEAMHLKFLGSPSFKLDGEDLWPEERTTYALSCRVYATAHGLKGAPTVNMLREKIRLYRSIS